MSKVHTSLATVAAAVSLFGAGVAIASPAHAATGFDRCPHGSFCLFSESTGDGTIGIFNVGSSDLRLQGLDNNVEAVWNRSDRSIVMYPGYNYTGEPLGGYGAYGPPKTVLRYVGDSASSVRRS